MQPPKVLRFWGYFKESVTESNIENHRVRRVVIYYYLADDSLQVGRVRWSARAHSNPNRRDAACGGACMHACMRLGSSLVKGRATGGCMRAERGRA
jgi:hypothetical protein